MAGVERSEYPGGMPLASLFPDVSGLHSGVFNPGHTSSPAKIERSPPDERADHRADVPFKGPR